MPTEPACSRRSASRSGAPCGCTWAPAAAGRRAPGEAHRAHEDPHRRRRPARGPLDRGPAAARGRRLFRVASLPPQAGVIALFAGLLCYGLIGRSRVAIVTATSSSAAVLASATLTLGGGDLALRLALASILVAGAGAAFVLAAALRLLRKRRAAPRSPACLRARLLERR